MGRLRDLLELRPGLPMTLMGLGYVSYGFYHVWGLTAPLPIDWFVVGMYELLALSVAYGGFRVTDRGRSFEDGMRVFGATIGFGFIGFVVAAALIALQLRRGVAVVEIWFLMLAASATTAAIGVGLALYYIDLRAERGHIAAQAETVSELNKQLTVLHRVLRHNLRNELTVIKGHAEMVLDSEPDVTAERSLRTLIEHAENVESLSENAYRLRQVWAEEAVVDQEVTEIVETCVREIEASHPGVEITTDVPAHAVASAHPRFQFAVSEALENAAMHNDPSAVEITISVRRRDPASAVELVIADTGAGIPDFEPSVLKQVEESPLKHATGLGLWLIYWVVEQSGGVLSFEANEPHGTVVRMTLPGAAG